jgi:squalene-hopene/tetraprenyl-beta-curcumene cyclase
MKQQQNERQEVSRSPAASPAEAVVDDVVEAAKQALFERQQADGHWVFDVEADSTIPSEYIFLKHYLDEVDEAVQAKIANYLRQNQAAHGGWPLFADGPFDISASVKSYFALKLAGDSPDAPHMARAREAILAHGGAEASNVFTRFSLALFGQVPWRAVPFMPIEIMLLPRWFPFHLSKVSYWSRTVIVPLLILMALKPRARNPRGVDIRELFRADPDKIARYNHNPTGDRLGALFLAADQALRRFEPYLPKLSRQLAINKAIAFITPRLNGEDGLGGIFPAMANAVMALDALGYRKNHPHLVTAKRSVDKLLSLQGDRGYCQPCLSPIWDTTLALHALLEAGEPADSARMRAAFDWLLKRQILNEAGDWSIKRTGLKPGGWAFQYWNDHYPDVDDTAAVVAAMQRTGSRRYRRAVERATQWIVGMQSSNGGWGAFDIDNTYFYLTHIPFADHGALLDPPTADVTARCVMMLCMLGYGREHPAVRRGLEYLRRDQEEDGSWYGRWGVNHIYGTWSVLIALEAAGEDMSQPYVREAIDWLLARQSADGGWGEDCSTYAPGNRDLMKSSTPSQTAWALLGLMAAGQVDSPAVGRGVAYLVQAPRTGANWVETLYTGTGFPRVFYLRYHGYSAYFPLWALSRYRNLMRGRNEVLRYGT